MGLSKFRPEQAHDDFITIDEVQDPSFGADAGVEDSGFTWIGTAEDIQAAFNSVNAKLGTRLGDAYTAEHQIKVMGATAPVNLTIPASTIVGRQSTGDVDALTAAEVRTLINVESGADNTAANLPGDIVYDGDFTANGYLERTGAGAYSSTSTIPWGDLSGVDAGVAATPSVTANSAKISYTDAAAVAANTAKVSCTTANVDSAGAAMNSDFTDLDGVTSLTVPNSTTISAYGATLINDISAAAARTTLELGNVEDEALSSWPGSNNLVTVNASAVTDHEHTLDINWTQLSGSITAATVAGDDKVVIQDTSNTNATRTVTAQAIADLAGGSSVSEMSDLTDADTTGASEGDYLKLSSGVWVDADFTADVQANRLDQMANPNQNIDFNGTALVQASIEPVDTLPGTGLVDGRMVYYNPEGRFYLYRGGL